MAGGPILPVSARPSSSNVYPVLFTRTSRTIECLGVKASLAANAIWHLYWQMPESLPTGTLTLRLHLIANATTGTARIDPNWLRIIPGTDRMGATLTSEGVVSVTWSTGDDYKIKEYDYTLDATTVPSAGDILEMDLEFETASWTLAATLGVLPSLIWI